MASQIKEINDDVFEATVAQGITLVDFWAPWCGPCKALTPILEEVASSTDEVSFVKVNVDDNKQAAGQYGIRGIPSLLVFNNGKLVETKVGLLNKEELLSLIENVQKSD
jgi:thioredoxin 1